jgi:hypothetical protein
MAASAEPSPRSFRSPQHVVGIQAVNSPRDAGTSAQFVKSFPLPILNPGSGIVTGDFDGDALQPSPPRVATSGFSVRRVPFGRPQGIPLSPFSPAGSLVPCRPCRVRHTEACPLSFEVEYSLCRMILGPRKGLAREIRRQRTQLPYWNRRFVARSSLTSPSRQLPAPPRCRTTQMTT